MSGKVSAAAFAAFLKARIGEGCIAGASGEDPRKLSDWYYSGQYAGLRLERALDWWEEVPRVWDANGLAEGFFRACTGEMISARLRYSWREWCMPRGSGLIPFEYRMPGAAVFKRAGEIYHAGFLVEPSGDGGDWRVVEARSVELGVVESRLYSGGWNLWGLMTRCFDYELPEERALPLGGRPLFRGCRGGDVRQLQGLLRRLGHDAAVDGVFGEETELLLRRMQAGLDLCADGVYGEESHAALMACIELGRQDGEEMRCRRVRVSAKEAWVHAAPVACAPLLTILRRGEELDSPAENDDWRCVMVNGTAAWLRRKDCEVL